MRVPVVNIWIMRVRVRERRVPVPVDVRLTRRIPGTVDMLVMLVVDVGLTVLEPRVGVPVLVVLREVRQRPSPMSTAAPAKGGVRGSC
jgi:hypothetical protein